MGKSYPYTEMQSVDSIATAEWASFIFEKNFFIEVYSAKHAHCLPVVIDKVGQSSKWKHKVFIEIEGMRSKKLGL